VIVTSNLPVGQWGTAFNGDDTLTATIHERPYKVVSSRKAKTTHPEGCGSRTMWVNFKLMPPVLAGQF